MTYNMLKKYVRDFLDKKVEVTYYQDNRKFIIYTSTTMDVIFKFNPSVTHHIHLN